MYQVTGIISITTWRRACFANSIGGGGWVLSGVIMVENTLACAIDEMIQRMSYKSDLLRHPFLQVFVPS